MEKRSSEFFGYRSSKSRLIPFLMVLSAVLLMVAGCSRGPAETPQHFVKSYLEKKISMTDISVADFFVKEERAGVIERVKSSIDTNNGSGGQAAHAGATIDLTKVNVKILDKKDYYVADEPKTFVKVEALGKYKVSDGEMTVIKDLDELIILEVVGDHWAVTEKIDPWK